MARLSEESPHVDPKDPDVVYIATIVSWKSVDGGKTWNAFRGAPGGDDYQKLWINPNNPDIILISSDQGAVTHITNGIPEGGAVNVVREDPKREGLLFAGTERQVYVSFDDGNNWQSLRLNMPATSIRDLIVKDDDVVVGTHGRGFWILDNITPAVRYQGCGS